MVRDEERDERQEYEEQSGRIEGGEDDGKR